MRCANQAWPSVAGWGSSSTRRSARLADPSVPCEAAVELCIAGFCASSPICRLGPESLHGGGTCWPISLEVTAATAGPILERIGRNGGGGSGRTLARVGGPCRCSLRRECGSTLLGTRTCAVHRRTVASGRPVHLAAPSRTLSMPSRACSYAPETAPISALKAMAAGAWPVTTGHAAPSSPGPCAVLPGAHAQCDAHDGRF